MRLLPAASRWGAKIAQGRTGELAVITGAELAMMTDTAALGHAPLGLAVFNRVARTTTPESVTWVKDSGRADAVR
ncbi:hypothetical protein E3N86_04450 [Cryobacterium sp. Hz7]|uniref:Uncharacterized protein n=1 Tax=Cryobacterium sandaracinum TaxID=1259247 RepID=A0ABY2J8A6_9MICO|nr:MULTISPECIES: hypothetical protein [Cryobacterium]TFB63580.1 hypothetical protein E3N86_04450 [Cryobacterium sp. Hz7]TFC65004.1 hypothetical protein E3O54_14225 [Cryobacterium sp. TMT2-4]TFC99898.1 hypothetical protein E3T25_13965 [Cryobacterium sandaracinum]